MITRIHALVLTGRRKIRYAQRNDETGVFRNVATVMYLWSLAEADRGISY